MMYYVHKIYTSYMCTGIGFFKIVQHIITYPEAGVFSSNLVESRVAKATLRFRFQSNNSDVIVNDCETFAGIGGDFWEEADGRNRLEEGQKRKIVEF